MLHLKSADMEDEVDCGWIRGKQRETVSRMFLSVTERINRMERNADGSDFRAGWNFDSGILFLLFWVRAIIAPVNIPLSALRKTLRMHSSLFHRYICLYEAVWLMAERSEKQF